MRTKLIIMLAILIYAGTIFATTSTKPSQTQQQELNNINDNNSNANAIGIGTGISDSNSTATSNSNSISAVKSDNTNVNTPIAVGHGGNSDVDIVTNPTISNDNTIKNNVNNTNIITPVVSPIIAPNVSSGAVSGSYSGPSTSSVGNTTAEAGDSNAVVGDTQAINNVVIGDNISESAAYSEGSTSEVSMGNINAGNSFSSSYFNSEKLDSYDTSVQVGSVRKSIPNISGYAGMNRYNYRDSWEFGVRVTVPLFTKVTDRAMEYEADKIEAEKNYLNAQIAALNSERDRANDMHTIEMNNVQNQYNMQQELAVEKHQAEMAMLCKTILENLTQVSLADSPDLWKVCNGFQLKNPPVKVVEKKIYIEKKPKPNPCELCEESKKQ